MKITYLSSSTIFSRSANSIHVINMCNAFSSLNHSVTLFALSKKKERLEKFYGLNLNNFSLIAPRIHIEKGKEFLIFILSLKLFFLPSQDMIICRNLYCGFFFGFLLKKSVIYETHTPEYGLRKLLQRKLILNCKTIVISNALKTILEKHHNISECKKIQVLHDASNADFIEIDNQKKINKKLFIKKFNFSKTSKLVGYFGHLYKGRGIEIIEKLAIKNSDINFLIFGGNENQINVYKNSNNNKNLYFIGFVDPAKVKIYMSAMDILIMPYQNNVSIGLKDINTSKWMSPMKLFEYMSVKVPIVSSDIPVLREILVSNENSIMVKPDDIKQWSEAIRQLFNNNSFASKLAAKSYKDFTNNYTWVKRASEFLRN